MIEVSLEEQQTYPDVETASAEYAARFAGPAGRYLLAVQERAVEELLEPYASGRLLDVGGGHGQLLGLYRRLNMKVTLHGSAQSCFDRLSEDEVASVERVVSAPHAIPIPTNSVDVAVSVRLLPHTEDWRALLREMCRIARHAVLVDYPSTRSLNALTPLLFGVKRKLEGNTRTYLSFSPGVLEAAFREHGFPDIAQRHQFFLPMVVHRVGRGSLPLRWAERLFQGVRLTQMVGSPVVIRASAEPGRVKPTITG